MAGALPALNPASGSFYFSRENELLTPVPWLCPGLVLCLGQAALTFSSCPICEVHMRNVDGLFIFIIAKPFEALVENFICMEKHSLKAYSGHNEGSEVLWFKKTLISKFSLKYFSNYIKTEEGY